MVAGDPLDGQVLLVSAVKASVPGKKLPILVDRTQKALVQIHPDVEQQFERIYEGDEYDIFLVTDGFWDELGDRLGLHRRELSAVRRAHEEQLRYVGRRDDREAEFDTALEIRDALVIGTTNDE